MIFQNHSLLILIIFAPIIGWWVWRYYLIRDKSRKRFADDSLWKVIAPSERWWVPLTRTILIFLAVLCLFIALARPKGGEIEVESSSEGIDIFLVMDMSKSMSVEDVGASRFIVQKKLAEAIIQNNPADRIGLIGFTGEPYVICPLTLDHITLLTFLETARIEETPAVPGTGIGDAIMLALRRFEGEDYSKSIILFTDGENNKGTNPAKAAREALKVGVKIYTIGIGTESGTRLFERDFFNRQIPRTYQNEPVIVKLDKGTLKDIAKITNGKPYFVEKLADANTVFVNLDRTSKAQFKSGKMTRKEELANWFLIAAALLMIADFIIDRFRLVARKAITKVNLNNNNQVKVRANSKRVADSES